MNQIGKKILVVDDERKIVDVITSYLEREGFLVYSAYSGNAALEMVKKVTPDFIILDLMLPDVSGEEVCRRIRMTSEIPIIMLTAKVQEEDRINGLDIGADDYVVKPFSPRELVSRVRAIMKRVYRGEENAVLSFQNGELVLDENRMEVIRKGERITFTTLEFKILWIMAVNPGKVFTRMELINKVQGYDFDGYERTIDAHIKNIRHKIEKDTRNPQYLVTVYGVGYKFGGEPDD